LFSENLSTSEVNSPEKVLISVIFDTSYLIITPFPLLNLLKKLFLQLGRTLTSACLSIWIARQRTNYELVSRKLLALGLYWPNSMEIYIQKIQLSLTLLWHLMAPTSCWAAWNATRENRIYNSSWPKSITKIHDQRSVDWILDNFPIFKKYQFRKIKYFPFILSCWIPFL
jgi:hypothetical protein